MYAIGLFDFCCTEPVLLICSYCLLNIIELLFLTIISMLEARRCFGVTVAPANVGMAAKDPELSLSPGAAHAPTPLHCCSLWPTTSISIIPDCLLTSLVPNPPRTKIFRGGPFYSGLSIENFGPGPKFSANKLKILVPRTKIFRTKIPVTGLVNTEDQ